MKIYFLKKAQDNKTIRIFVEADTKLTPLNLKNEKKMI